MVEFVIEMLVGLPVLLLWLTMVSVLVRPFGIVLSLNPFSWAKHKSAFQGLTFSQYLMVCGVLYFGCGMFVEQTLLRYLEWRYWHGPSNTSEHPLRDGLQYLFSGVLFGVIGQLSLRSSTK